MKRPLVQAVIRGLALLEQATSPSMARISPRMELESCTPCECHGDVESTVFPQATKPEVLPGVKVYCLPRKY